MLNSPSFFENITPTIHLADIANRAFSLGSMRALLAGGALLTAGFLWRLLPELWHLLCSKPTDFGRPLLHLLFFSVVFIAYRPLTAWVVQGVSHLGADLGGGGLLHETFAHRMHAFQAYSALQHGEVPTGMLLTRDGLATLLMEGTACVLYIAVQAAAFVIKTIQLFTLATIIAAGPILLGFAALTPFFHHLGLGWFWALVEVSAWSFTMDVMLFIFDGMGRHIPPDFIFAQEMVICAVILVGLLSITRITAMLVRGDAAAALGQSVFGQGGRHART